MPLQKQYAAKVYEPDGSTYITTYTTAAPLEGGIFIKNDPQFHPKLNGGMGEYVIDLNFPFDEFDEGGSIAIMNVVDLYCYDSAYPDGRRIYRGFISRYEPYLEAGDEGVKVTCLGLNSLYTYTYYSNTAHAAVDPTVIAKAIIDHVDTLYPDLLSYDASSIPSTVGSNVSITFSDQKHNDALKKTLDTASAGWWTHTDENGKFNMKAKPSTATHTFTVNKDIVSLYCPKDSEKIINDVSLAYDGGNVTSSDATSITAYGTRTTKLSDSQYKNATAAQNVADKKVSEEKNPRVKAILTVNTEYDLESIKIGETCKIRNLKLGSTFFNDNMQIVGIDYSPDECRLELEEQAVDFGREMQRFVLAV